MKLNHRLLVFAAAVALLAGCASNDHQNSGAMGNDSQIGSGTSNSDIDQGANNPGGTPVAPAPAPRSPTGPNGSVGPGNPFGAGSGSGLQRAN